MARTRRTLSTSGDSLDAGLRFFGKTDRRPAGTRFASHDAWIVLMKRLGYTRYVAQGGDWGAIITRQMAVQAPPELVGIHTNMPGAVPVEIDRGGPDRCTAAVRPRSRREASVRTARLFLSARPGLRARDGEPPADAVRDCGFTCWPRRMDSRPRRAQLRADRPASSTVSPRASRETTSSTTSRSTG